MESDNMKQIVINFQAADQFSDKDFDLDRILLDIDSEIDLLSSQADIQDYLVSMGSGVLCALLDILWVGEFNLSQGRELAKEKVDSFVVKMANLLGCEKDDVKSAVTFLEGRYHLAADGNTPEFGGGLQHHLRDFAHHPTIVGLFFSLLTQFTGKSYGTDTNGNFLIVDIVASSKQFIGQDVPTKILNGTIKWFFHLVSDMAGSSSTAGLSGGTGIPGPILSMAKELSVLPLFKKIGSGDMPLSVFISKLFNGTLLAKRDEKGNLIKETVLRFDLRGELGLGIELGRQAIPVVANECIVRSFYLIRHLGLEIRANNIESIDDFKQIEWAKIRPSNNPTVDRMLLIATGIFTTIDIGEAIVAQKYFLAINYVGVGRFAIAVGEDSAWFMKARKVKEIKQMYEEIERNVFRHADNKKYESIGEGMNIDKFGLTVEQTGILYNLEYYKTLYDVVTTKSSDKNDERGLKQEWLEEWKEYITKGFPSFIGIEGTEIHWYSEEELIKAVERNTPKEPWFRLVILEAMLFEPYYPLGTAKDKKGKDIPSPKYKMLQKRGNGFKTARGDEFIEAFFAGDYYSKGYTKRLRKTYKKVIRELNETYKTAVKSIGIAVGVAAVAMLSAGAFAPVIAKILVGSNFAGLSGVALGNASLAYLGGGAIAAGGAGMAGGTAVIVGGGGLLGFGIGAGAGSSAALISMGGRESTILQSAKLIVSIREVFLNDEKDTLYTNSIYEQYLLSILEVETGITKMRLELEVAQGNKKKELQEKINNAEKSVEVMKTARDSMKRFISSFEEGLKVEK